MHKANLSLLFFCILMANFCPVRIAMAGVPNEIPLDPEITINIIYKYSTAGWVGETVTVTTGTVDIRAHEFCININNDLPQDAANHIRLLGDNRKFEPTAKWLRGVGLAVRDHPLKEHYVLLLDKELMDVAGHALGGERRIEINVQPPTEARFDLIGRDDIYSNVGFFGGDSDWSALHFTNQPKEILIAFSRDVDHASVESALGEGFREKKARWSLNWINDKSTTLKIDGLLTKEFYDFSLGKAHDKDGFPIQGRMSFAVHERSHLSRTDLVTSQTHLIKEFNDRVYEAKRFPFMGHFIILDDGRSESVLDSMTGKIGRVSLPGWLGMSNACWVDDSRFLYVHKNRMVMRDMVDGKESVICSGFLPADGATVAVSLSPNARHVALMCAPWRLLVFSMNGNRVFQNTEPISLLEKDNSFDLNLCWLDPRTLLFDARLNPRNESDGTFAIFKLDLTTKQVAPLIVNAWHPVVSSDGLTMLYDRLNSESLITHYYVNGQGRETEVVSLRDRSCEHLFFTDSKHLVFEETDSFDERKNNIIFLDLISGQESALASGTIIGPSADRRQLYINSFQGEVHWTD